MNSFGPQVDIIIARLKAIDRTHPVIDCPRAEQAIVKHFHALKITPLPMRWVVDAEIGYSIAWSAAWSAARSAAWNAAWSAARNAAWNAARNAAWNAARNTARNAAWNAARSAAWSVAWSVAESVAESAAWNAAWNAARNAAWSVAWSAAESVAESAAWNTARSAARNATWNAAWSAAESVAESKNKKHRNNVWLPFVDAYEAGLWIFWVLNKEILLVPRPTTHIVGHQLHRDDGPAVWWPNGAQYFFLHGVRVPAAVVLTDSDQLDPSLILTERNAEVRREIVRKIGIERVCTNLHAKVMDREGTYELLLLELKDGRQQPWLKMKNPSIGVYHIEGVHPHCRTVKEALKWRNGVEASPSILT